MSDTTACMGKQCPDKMNCLRYRGLRNQYWQSYAAYDDERLANPGKPCTAFIKLYEGDRLRELDSSEK